MRVLFMGTPELACGILGRLAQAHEVVGVFTRPDAVRGRGKSMLPSPVKVKALELALAVYTPESLKAGETVELVSAMAPDVVCVVAYGSIIPKPILELPRFGCVNVHTSLLPRWRGAAPIERSILAGDEKTGVSIMKMEEGLDTGPYCAQSELDIGERDLKELEAELSRIGADSLIESLGLIERGDVIWQVQPDEGVTYAEKIAKVEMKLDPDDAAEQNLLRVRASSDAHPARACVAGKMLTVVRACRVEDEGVLQDCSRLLPGEAKMARKHLVIASADGLLELLEVKPDGKKSMDASSFASGIQGIKKNTISWERA